MTHEAEPGVRRLPRVLLLDDDEATLRAFARAFRGEAEIIGVSDARKTTEILRSDEWLDAAIFDILGVDGHAVARKARELRPDLPIAMLSGSHEPADLNPAAVAGFVLFAKAEVSTIHVLEWIRAVTLQAETLASRRERIVEEHRRAHGLAPRHARVIVGRLQHWSTSKIAKELGTKPATIRVYENETRDLLGVDDLRPILDFLATRVGATRR